jgi:hypothetical protein
MLFVNMQGFHVRVIQEVDVVSAVAAPPPPPPNPTNDEDEDAAESNEDHWDGRRGRHKSKEPHNQAPKNLGKAVGTSRKSVQLRHLLPCADEVEVLTSLSRRRLSLSTTRTSLRTAMSSPGGAIRCIGLLADRTHGRRLCQ